MVEFMRHLNTYAVVWFVVLLLWALAVQRYFLRNGNSSFPGILTIVLIWVSWRWYNYVPPLPTHLSPPLFEDHTLDRVLHPPLFKDSTLDQFSHRKQTKIPRRLWNSTP
jgi:hypothetical protein